MSTVTRPELSKKNTYWIEKHRYYELKHFCLQYSIWKDKLKEGRENADYYEKRLAMVDEAALKTDDYLGEYILKAVTEEISYDCLSAKYRIPCCKDVYYDLYRKFFWLLDGIRN